MDLGTFGAILRFAMDLEKEGEAFYRAGAQGGLEGPFRELAEAGTKRLKDLERARREGVAEMILESISGLDGDSYQIALDPGLDEARRLKRAIAFEEAAARFYRDAAGKVPIREVVRLFVRLAEGNAARRARLAALESGR